MPRDLVLLAAWARSSHVVARYVSLCLLAMVYGCVRLRHFVRSRIIRLDDAGFLVLEAYRGKTRRDGAAAPPIIWAVPRTSQCKTVDVPGTLFKEAAELVGPDAPRLLPQLDGGADVFKATGFGARKATPSQVA